MESKNGKVKMTIEYENGAENTPCEINIKLNNGETQTFKPTPKTESQYIGKAPRAATVPVTLNNHSVYRDDEVYIAILGRQGNNSIYYDLVRSSQSSSCITGILNDSLNSLHKVGGDWGYANVFYKLSDIRNKTIYIGDTFSCRMFFGFRSPMFLHAFADGGYAGADLNNPSDPNLDFRWEFVEFTNNDGGIWINTTRVDAFLYPMGLELYGKPDADVKYIKRGELLKYSDIINKWSLQESGSVYKDCYSNNITKDNLGGIIKQPSKVASIKAAGIFDGFINKVWDFFRYRTLKVRMGVLGYWEGRVNGDTFSITCKEGNYWKPGTEAKIYGKPSTTDVIEGAGQFAQGNDVDKSVQAMFCGAFNRGVISLREDIQDWSPTGSRYFNEGNPFNDYVRFFHQTDVTFDGYTYAFAYDDTFDQSSTCHTNKPDKVVIAIGGYASSPSTKEIVTREASSVSSSTYQPLPPKDLEYANIRELPYYFKWNNKCEADSFNVYVNQIFIGNTTGNGFDIPSKFFEKKGYYTISITSLLNGVESEETKINWSN